MRTISVARVRQKGFNMQHTTHGLLRVQIRATNVYGPGKSPRQQQGGSTNQLNLQVLRILVLGTN